MAKADLKNQLISAFSVERNFRLAFLLSWVAALFDGMMAVFTIISAITFCYHSGIILGEMIAFFAITSDKVPSFFAVMAAVFTGII